MIDFYQQFAESLKQKPVVLATVIYTKGSVPREVGAKMVICSRECTIGTIGGGAGEAKVIHQALKVLETGYKQWVEIDLSGAPQRETQGVCGGTMQIWLERWQGDTALTIVHQILGLLRSGQPGTIVTPLTADQHPYLDLTSTAETHLPIIFTESLRSPPTLLIIGAGHVAVPLAQVAHLAGFQVVVQDDRPEFACVQRFPTATTLTQPIVTTLNTLTASELYVTLVTRGYRHDLAALQILLQRSVHYIGMIGSEKRVKTVFQALQQEGIPGEPEYTADQLQKIYAPIGLDIGALTPEEIAVSICAELIKVRRGGTGLPLSEKIRRAGMTPFPSKQLR